MGDFSELYRKDKEEAKGHCLSFIFCFTLMMIYLHLGLGIYFSIEQCLDPQDYPLTPFEESILKMCREAGIIINNSNTCKNVNNNSGCKSNTTINQSGNMSNFLRNRMNNPQNASSVKTQNIRNALQDTCKILSGDIEAWEEFKTCKLTKMVYIKWMMVCFSIMFTTGKGILDIFIFHHQILFHTFES